MYDLYSQFDIEQHSEHYPHYLEVIMYQDGTVEYAVPSHQEKLIQIACDMLDVSRTKLFDMCPQEYYCDVITWLCNITGCISVWTNFYMKSDKNDLSVAQEEMLRKLQRADVYEGEL